MTVPLEQDYNLWELFTSTALQEFGFWFTEPAVRALALHLQRHIVVIPGGRKGRALVANLYIYPKSTAAWYYEGNKPKVHSNPMLLFYTCEKDGTLRLPSICFEVDTIVIMHNGGEYGRSGTHFWKTCMKNPGIDLLAMRTACQTSGVIITEVLSS